MPKHKSRPDGAQGRVYHLRKIFRRLNGLYFGGEVKARIEWGKGRGTKARRSREFGTYYYGAKLIRIHPVLDQIWVPLYVVESVIHHEMCHQICPEEVHGSRRMSHTAEFKRREREFLRHAESTRWFNKNVRKVFKPAPQLEKPAKVTKPKQLRIPFAA